MPSGKPAPKKKPTTTPKKTAAQIAAENARIAHMTAGGGAPPNRPGNAASSYETPGPLMSPPKAWQPLGTEYLGPQAPNHTGPTSNMPGMQIPGGLTPGLIAAIKAQNTNATGGFPGNAGDIGAALGGAAAKAASGIAGQLPQAGTQLPGGGVQPEGPDTQPVSADPLAGFQDPYAAQRANFEQQYGQAIPNIEAIRALYSGRIQGYGADAQQQAVGAQGGIQAALAAALAQNQQSAQGVSADLTTQGVDPSKFNAQAASQGGLLSNQSLLQDALSKRLAQVQGQQTQANLTTTDLASQGARQNLESTKAAGMAAYGDKTAAAKNDYQTQMAKIAADEQIAAAKAASSGGGGSGGGGSSKNASGLTAYQQAQLDKGVAKDTKAAAKAVDNQKSLGALLSSSLGRSPQQIQQALQNGSLSESDLVTHLRDNVGLNAQQIIDALKGFHLANTPSVMQPKAGQGTAGKKAASGGAFDLFNPGNAYHK